MKKMKALKWFVIESDVDGSWMDFTYCYTMGDAVQKALRVWRCGYSLKDRKHRMIQVAELWAVYDEDEERWFPMMETDEGFDRKSMEGYWIGAYNSVLTIGPED